MKRILLLLLVTNYSIINCSENFNSIGDDSLTLKQITAFMKASVSGLEDKTTVNTPTDSSPLSKQKLRYKCHETETCPFNGTSFNGLKTHLSTKHKDTKLKTQKKCPTCGKRYSYHSLHPASACLVIDAASAESTRQSNIRRKQSSKYLAKRTPKTAGKS